MMERLSTTNSSSRSKRQLSFHTNKFISLRIEYIRTGREVQLKPHRIIVEVCSESARTENCVESGGDSAGTGASKFSSRPCALISSKSSMLPPIVPPLIL
uniref:Uncharacterized protein n=1 Tax=Glossina pallidipes TaxID=7398 RepID=A0A1A9Z2P1_GLOPL